MGNVLFLLTFLSFSLKIFALKKIKMA